MLVGIMPSNFSRYLKITRTNFLLQGTSWTLQYRGLYDLRIFGRNILFIFIKTQAWLLVKMNRLCRYFNCHRHILSRPQDLFDALLFVPVQFNFHGRFWMQENIGRNLKSIHGKRSLIRGGCCYEVIRVRGHALWRKHLLIHLLWIVTLISEVCGALSTCVFLSWLFNAAPLFKAFLLT